MVGVTSSSLALGFSNCIKKKVECILLVIMTDATATFAESTGKCNRWTRYDGNRGENSKAMSGARIHFQTMLRLHLRKFCLRDRRLNAYHNRVILLLFTKLHYR